MIMNKDNYSGYLDIETTSLSPYNGELTVVGLCLEEGQKRTIIQLVEDQICLSNLMEIVEKVNVLYTYNGTRFDLPYIKEKLKVDLTEYCIHKDLMYECWSRNLYGGLKGIERKLGIGRKLTDINGSVAVELWHNYKYYGDRNSLNTLLEYNKEDVLNLVALKERLIKNM